jgi:GNAT superfamily N-acetyltransferase
MQYPLRLAKLEDRPVLEQLIARSAHGLSVGDYTSEQVDAALRGAFGVDTQLILDGTYFVAEDGDTIVACGGWSRRRTLFGGDAHASRNASELDPNTDAAKIRAFFVDPAYARRGIGRAILRRCEAEARAYGFKRFEMMATVPGARLYATEGYVPMEMIRYPLGGGIHIEFLPMIKQAE